MPETLRLTTRAHAAQRVVFGPVGILTDMTRRRGEFVRGEIFVIIVSFALMVTGLSLGLTGYYLLGSAIGFVGVLGNSAAIFHQISRRGREENESRTAALRQRIADRSDDQR
jgi:small basic protein